MSVVSPAQNLSPTAAPDSWAPFQEMLRAQRSACLEEIRELTDALPQNGLDPVMLARQESLENTLEQVHRALERIDAGTYGSCVHCGTAIPVERLELRPHAAGCVSCSAAR
jgi:RNA polymerase-binding transcription factor DksA